MEDVKLRPVSAYNEQEQTFYKAKVKLSCLCCMLLLSRVIA